MLQYSDIASTSSPAHLLADGISNEIIGKIFTAGPTAADYSPAVMVGQISLLQKYGLPVPATRSEAAAALNAYAKDRFDRGLAKRPLSTRA